MLHRQRRIPAADWTSCSVLSCPLLSGPGSESLPHAARGQMHLRPCPELRRRRLLYQQVVHPSTTVHTWAGCPRSRPPTTRRHGSPPTRSGERVGARAAGWQQERDGGRARAAQVCKSAGAAAAAAPPTGRAASSPQNPLQHPSRAAAAGAKARPGLGRRRPRRAGRPAACHRGGGSADVPAGVSMRGGSVRPSQCHRLPLFTLLL